MHRKILWLLLLLFLVPNYSLSQSFIYMNKAVLDSAGNFESSDILRLNLQKNTKERYLNSLEPINYLVWDPSQRWITIEYYRNYTEIYNSNDTSKVLDVPIELRGVGDGFLFSDSDQKIYFFSALNGAVVQFSKLDIISNDIDSLFILPYGGVKYNVLNEEAFFSNNDKVIYFTLEDTNYIPRRADKDKVAYFSTITDQIIGERELSEIGYPNSDGYILHKGRKGKSIVQSFFWNESKDSYYRIYDFDSDSGSGFVLHRGYCNPYFTDDGKLVLAETFDSAYVEYLTGKLFIYDVASLVLVKTLNLLPRGKIYTFDNYPNDIYYINGPLDSTSIVTDININTIANSADLIVKLINSSGSLLTSGSLQYYEESWKDAISYNNGIFGVNTDKSTISLRMTYEYGNQTIQNVPVRNDTAVFQTVNVSVQLKDSQGNLMDNRTVQYYAGAWRNFGTTTNGVASKELLPENLTFRANYNGSHKDKTQDISSNDLVEIILP